MAREKNKKSKLTFMNLGLTPEEDKVILKKLKDEDISARQLLRKWFKEWISNPM